MPGHYFQPIDRRQFLKTTVLAGAATVVQVNRTIAQSASEDEIHLALLADTHIGPGEAAKDPRGFDPCEQLRHAIPDIIAASPSGVILVGDAASRAGLPEDYQELKGILEPLSSEVPVYIGLGNHDHRENFHEVFPPAVELAADVRDHHVLVIEEPFVRFIVLDSLLYVNTAAGLLGEYQRLWLIDFLETHTDKQVVLFVHHTLGDGDRELLDANRLFDIIRPHSQVKAIFYGHSHSWVIGERDGVKLINLPSLGYNFWEGEPVGWVDARFRPDGVDLTMHAIAGNQDQDGQTTEISWT